MLGLSDSSLQWVIFLGGDLMPAADVFMDFYFTNSVYIESFSFFEQ
jgi:hypothetical protein